MTALRTEGFTLDREHLGTVDGCSRAIRQIKAERARLDTVTGQYHRIRRRAPDEEAALAGVRAEHARLGLMCDEVKTIRAQLSNDDRLRWERMFVHVAHEVLDEATYARISNEAAARVENQQRVTRSLNVGAAIPMRGAASTPKVRA